MLEPSGPGSNPLLRFGPIVSLARYAWLSVATALVTMGFFHDTEPNPARHGDNRLVRTRAVIERSTADFVDIHPYADDELTFPQFMQNYGIDGPTPKPIVIGWAHDASGQMAPFDGPALAAAQIRIEQINEQKELLIALTLLLYALYRLGAVRHAARRS